MDLWPVTVVGHIGITLAYIVIAAIVGRGLTRTNQWASNPLGAATFAIFASCALGHGLHIWHALATAIEPAEIVEASRTTMSDWPLVAWTLVTAGVAILYLLRRRRLDALHGGSWMALDVARRMEEANAVQAQILERVRTARDTLREGDLARAEQDLSQALESSKRIVADLLPPRHEVKPGSVRRRDHDE